jgi:N-acetylmuramoyl-L-alanine amidase
MLSIGVVLLNRSQTEDTSEAMVQPTIGVSGTICIDAGHGGSDTGAISPDGSTNEKDDNLALALKVQEKLQAMNLTVVMTRTDDSTIELNERCKIANTENVDLFVSLHRNSSESTSANGVEVWIHNSQPPIDTALAYNILNALQGVGIQSNRGVELGYRGDSSENYRVNKLTTMPSCLVETGFLSNDVDRELYSTHMDDYANAIANAIYQTLEDVANGLVDTSRGKAGQNWNGFGKKY